MLHILRFFFSSKCRLFHNATFFGSCVIHSLYTGCAKKLKKKKSGAKGLNTITKFKQQMALYVIRHRKIFIETQKVVTSAPRLTAHLMNRN